MEDLTFVCPCIFGVEGVCANELRFLGFKNVRAENGRVLFSGGLKDMVRANIFSRYAERVLILMGEFSVCSFEELFEKVKSLRWDDFIGENDAFPVKGRCLSSKLMSVPDCQKIIKKAVVEHLRTRYSVSWFQESGPLFQIQFLVMNDKASIMIDTSGAGLHKRGYRQKSNDAPIKETLAAAMAELAGVRRNHSVVDPMCGSGTILIESAMKALKIPPGLNRGFAFDNWGFISTAIVDEIKAQARASIDEDCAFCAVGSDIDRNALLIAEDNAKKAGVSRFIRFESRDIRGFTQEFSPQTVITNPPYGERLLDIKTARELYRILGERLLTCHNTRIAVISPDDEFERIFGKTASKRRKLYNGMLKCQLYIYR